MTGRHERLSNLLDLVLRLQSSAQGLSLDQIGDLYAVARRTAERMLRAVQRVLPELESQVDDDGRKYWHLPRRTRAAALVGVEAEEIAVLETMAERSEREGRSDHASALRSLALKVRTLVPADSALRLETDTGALLEAEGIAMRPGPHLRIKLELVTVLRQGILACREVQLHYHSRIRNEESHRAVRPYGFLLGGRHYLVAHDVATSSVRLFSLSNILGAELTATFFERPASWDLREYAARSFGVFQEEPHDVVLRFRPEVAGRAREYAFHPSQVVESRADGSVVVRFRAGGIWEMAWHLFQWRDGVEVVAPEALRRELVAMLEDALRVHRGA